MDAYSSDLRVDKYETLNYSEAESLEERNVWCIMQSFIGGRSDNRAEKQESFSCKPEWL